jgi:hypothetical protein
VNFSGPKDKDQQYHDARAYVESFIGSSAYVAVTGENDVQYPLPRIDCTFVPGTGQVKVRKALQE